MRWYNHLYVGEKAARRRFSIIQGIREHKLQPEVYVITLPKTGNHILDIYPSAMLFLPPFQNEEFTIIGIAVTYWEALLVVRDIVDDLYRETGAFDIRSWIE